MSQREIPLEKLCKLGSHAVLMRGIPVTGWSLEGTSHGVPSREINSRGNHFRRPINSINQRQFDGQNMLV